MAARIKGRKLKDLTTTIQKNSFIKDFNSTDMTFLSLMNDKSRAEALEKTVVSYYYEKLNNGDKYRVLVVADEQTIKEWNMNDTAKYGYCPKCNVPFVPVKRAEWQWSTIDHLICPCCFRRDDYV